MNINFWQNGFMFYGNLNLLTQVTIMFKVKYRHPICSKFGDKFLIFWSALSESQYLLYNQRKYFLLSWVFGICCCCYSLTYLNIICLAKEMLFVKEIIHLKIDLLTFKNRLLKWRSFHLRCKNSLPKLFKGNYSVFYFELT